jgi:adenine-specific DNA-methyltransferase
MRATLLRYLKDQFSQDPFHLDRLIISAFTEANNLNEIRNELLLEYIIQPSQYEERSILDGFLKIFAESKDKFDFETLIALFEFVVSPSDKVVNGAVYTHLNTSEAISS